MGDPPEMLAAIRQLREDIRVLGKMDKASMTRPVEAKGLQKRTAVTAPMTTNQDPKASRTLLIVMGVVGGVFVVLLILLIVCCVIRRRGKKLGFKTSTEDILGNFFSHSTKSKVSDIGKESNDNVLSFFLPQPPPRNKFGYRKSIMGRVNPDMYKGGTDEAIRFSQGAGLGTVEFSIVMEKGTGNLIVAVLRVTGIPERIVDGNRTEPRNPFVRVTLLPDQVSHQTKVQRGTVNPLFNECVVFTVVPAAVIQKRLRISVYDVDRKNTRHSLGNVIIPLETIDLQEEIFYRLALEKLEKILHTHLGDLELSLTVIPDAGKIKVGVLSCKGFNEFSYDPNSDHKCNVFVRTYMFRGQRMIRMRETRSSRLHSDIFFNEYFNFSSPFRHMDQTHFMFMIILSTGVKDPGVPVGKVELGPYQFARGEELMHWQQAMDNPRNTITMFHMIESPEEGAVTRCCE